MAFLVFLYVHTIPGPGPQRIELPLPWASGNVNRGLATFHRGAGMHSCDRGRDGDTERKVPGRRRGGRTAARRRWGWLLAGDRNAFFGLTLDNLSKQVILWGLLVGLFRFPPDLVLHRMIPGTAIGVLIGDRIYTWMAFRVARQTGRDDVTAMPLGIDTPSLFGLAFGVLGPVFVATRDADRAWKVGVAVLVLMGIPRTVGSFARATGCCQIRQLVGRGHLSPARAAARAISASPGDGARLYRVAADIW